jgi:hypothetical protein
MRRCVPWAGLLGVLCMLMTGCAPLLLGVAVGGVSMYAASKDTVYGDTDTPYDVIWTSARNIARIRGKIIRESEGEGVINVQTDSGKVWIRLQRLTDSTTRINVSARKYHFPNLSLAQELFVKIMEQAA